MILSAALWSSLLVRSSRKLPMCLKTPTDRPLLALYQGFLCNCRVDFHARLLSTRSLQYRNEFFQSLPTETTDRLRPILRRRHFERYPKAELQASRMAETCLKCRLG